MSESIGGLILETSSGFGAYGVIFFIKGHYTTDLILVGYQLIRDEVHYY
ncbi:hypothetical protein VCRA2128O106_10533 [Vibrio crassostreae]|nr:hypothetical protein VCRA2127O91_120032 [Vibrio crassostreae]CAK2620906.1 hypothetical protein VCRA2128O100_130101 [Vibrio crassostreae]CAK2743114.1 hypothetical protein VCRA2128O106_10533 [Vibrio crassostreae]CAK2743575.1 hypothetical protein VCRA2125O83_10533 [Vibrio crassostreae]CAK3112206.1 hypothetical protein VCRA2128O101_130029 [Vibrio crassostreae]